MFNRAEAIGNFKNNILINNYLKDAEENDNGINRIFRIVIRGVPLISIIVMSIIYVYFWSVITVDRYYALNQPVADLGLAVESIWSTTQNVTVSVSLLQSFFYYSGPYYLFWVSYISNMSIFLLIFQSSFLGFSSIPIFFIAKKERLSDMQALSISTIFLLYFPMSGINWFAFHFQAMFIPLFLTSYYLYIAKKYRAAFFLFLIGGMVKFPFMIFVVLFAIVEILRKYSKAHRGQLRLKAFLGSETYLSILLISSSIILMLEYFLIINNNLTTSVYIHSSASNLSLYFSTAYTKLITILLIFAPFAFLPFLSKRWLPLYLPFLLLIIFSNSSIYMFPVIFHIQYVSMVIPFLFLGLIEVIARLPGPDLRRNGKIKNASLNSSEPQAFLNRRKVIISIFLFILLFSLFFQPYGPLNSYNPDDFSITEQTAFNMTQYNYLVSEAKLIPANNPYVLMQNNMPELFPRLLDYNSSPLSVGLTPFAPNLSVGNAVSNSYPKDIAGKWTNVKIDYAIGDGYTTSYFNSHYPGSPSMLDFLNILYDSGKYGIYAQQGSVILLKRDFNGSPILYAPYNLNFEAIDFSELAPNATFSNGTINYFNLTQGSLFTTISSFVPPGVYNVSLDIKSTRLSPNDSMNINIYAVGPSGTTKLSSNSVNSTEFADRITFQITVNAFYDALYVKPYVETWMGSLSVSSIYLNQIEPL